MGRNILTLLAGPRNKHIHTTFRWLKKQLSWQCRHLASGHGLSLTCHLWYSLPFLSFWCWRLLLRAHDANLPYTPEKNKKTKLSYMICLYSDKQSNEYDWKKETNTMWELAYQSSIHSKVWDCSLTLLFTSLSLGRISRLKPSAWPRVRFPPFMKFPKAKIRPRTLFTVSLSCKVCRGNERDASDETHRREGNSWGNNLHPLLSHQLTSCPPSLHPYISFSNFNPQHSSPEILFTVSSLNTSKPSLSISSSPNIQHVPLSDLSTRQTS